MINFFRKLRKPKTVAKEQLVDTLLPAPSQALHCTIFTLAVYHKQPQEDLPDFAAQRVYMMDNVEDVRVIGIRPTVKPQ